MSSPVHLNCLYPELLFMKRSVILEFPTYERRNDFITALDVSGYTLNNEKPIVYCKLSKQEIESATTDFGAKDTSYNDSGNYLFYSFLDTLEGVF